MKSYKFRTQRTLQQQQQHMFTFLYRSVRKMHISTYDNKSSWREIVIYMILFILIVNDSYIHLTVRSYRYAYHYTNYHSNIIAGRYNHGNFQRSGAIITLPPQHRTQSRTNVMQRFQEIPKSSHETPSSSTQQEYMEEEESIDIDTVSDAEALLACYAYLQRKNLLSEWSSINKESVLSPKSSSNNINTRDDETIGYFWENLNELRYYNPKNQNKVVYRQQQMLHQNNETPPLYTNSTIMKLPNRNLTTTTTTPILKSIEGTGYNYIENFVPENTDYFYDNSLVTTDVDTDNNVVAEVVATKMTTELMLHQKNYMTSVPMEPISNNKHMNEQLPMYINHPNNVWDIIDDDDIGTNDIDTHIPPMYRKNYRILNEDNEYYINHYNRNDDDTLDVLRFRRRSNRFKQLFQNTTWKEQWYTSRWGSMNQTKESRQQMKLNRRLQEKLTSSSRLQSSSSSSSSSTNTPKASPPFYTTSMTTTLQPPIDNKDDLSSQAMGLLLHSQLISRLDDDVIADAIVTYMNANRKRSIRRKFTNQYRKTFLLQKHNNIIANQRSNDSNHRNRTTASGHNMTLEITPQQFHHYHTIDNHTLTITTSEEERKRQRSEKAKKAYQTRLQNEKLRQRQRNEVDQYQTTNPIQSVQEDSVSCLIYPFDNLSSGTISLTPTAAYERIDRLVSLLSNDTTSILSSTTTIAPALWDDIHQLRLFQRDVELVLHPRKLPQRKELLLRIMRHQFQLRGLCIPISHSKLQTSFTNDNNYDDASIQSSSSSDLGPVFSSSTTTEYKFMTKASVQELGSYILQRIDDHIDGKFIIH